MKYVNQINMAVAAVAAAAVVYAFSMTYFGPAQPPPIVIDTPAAEETAAETPPNAVAPERATPAAAGPRATPTRPTAQVPGGRAIVPRQPNRGPQQQVGRPVPGRPAPTPAPPERQGGPPPSESPADRATTAPGPGRQPSGGAIRPAAPPANSDEEQAERDSPRSFPQTPEGARRDQDRRGSPNPPPARSSMPEQRPLY